MGYDLSNNLKDYLNNAVVTPQLVLAIDGISKTFSYLPFTIDAVYGLEGLEYGDSGLLYGITVTDPNNKDYINLKGTTKSITQQLDHDKAGTGSITSMNVSLVDVADEVTALFSDKEMLARRVEVYLNFAELSHPDDSIRIFSGVISSVQFPQKQVKLIIDSPNTLKKQDLFSKITDKLDGAIDATQTTIDIENTNGILLPTDIAETYVQIDDEVIKVDNIGGNSLVNCTRGAFNTVAATHENGADVNTFYYLKAQPIDMALKLMLSSEDDAFETLEPIAFNTYDAGTIDRAIYFNQNNIEESLGLVVGDKIDLTGTTSNDGTDLVIEGFGTITSSVSYVIVDTVLVTEPATGAADFKSKYNVLNDGCNMSPKEVDVKQHEYIQDTFGNAFPELSFYLKDTINAKSFIDEEILFPIGAYYLPRKGRVSVGYTAPSLVQDDTVAINESNITNAASIVVKRSISKNFYNSIVYKLDEYVLEEDFKQVRINISEESRNRIDTGERSLTIESKGLRDNQETLNYVDNVASNMLDRYKFGARTMEMEVTYTTGFSLEVGDTVLFDGSNISVYNEDNNSRDNFVRVMEVTNKSMDVTTGKVKIELTDTSFQVEARYSTVAAASKVVSGTTNSIKIEPSFGNSLISKEIEKWESSIGKKIKVRNDDFSEIHHVTLNSTSGDTLFISTLPVTPDSTYIVEWPDYSEADEIQKLIHAYIGPQVEIASGISTTQFTVADASIFFVGAILDVHSDDYASRSEVKVTDVTGLTITTEDMGFTPASGYLVDRIGFVDDNGYAYLYI